MATTPVQRPQYPDALREDVAENLHGTIVADPYRWLEDAADPRTNEWVSAQNALLDAERGEWTRRESFAERVDQLLQSGSVSPPYFRGNRIFFTRRNPGQQFAVLYVREGAGEERVLIDPMELDPSGLTTLDAWQPSKEGDRLSYQLSEGGTEESVVYVMDVATGERIDGPIDRCRFSPTAWIPGGEAFYYVRRIDPALLPESEAAFHRRVYLHTVGTSTDEDVVVFGAGMNMTNYYGVEVSRDGHWLQVSASEGTEPRNDLWIADLTQCPADQPAFTLVQGDTDAQTSLSFGRDGRVYVFTDLDAPRGRLAVTAPGALLDILAALGESGGHTETSKLRGIGRVFRALIEHRREGHHVRGIQADDTDLLRGFLGEQRRDEDGRDGDHASKTGEGHPSL